MKLQIKPTLCLLGGIFLGRRRENGHKAPSLACFSKLGPVDQRGWDTAQPERRLYSGLWYSPERGKEEPLARGSEGLDLRGARTAVLQLPWGEGRITSGGEPHPRRPLWALNSFLSPAAILLTAQQALEKHLGGRILPYRSWSQGIQYNTEHQLKEIRNVK